MSLHIHSGDYTSSGFVLRKEYEKKIIESLTASQSIFENADKSFKTCDPDDFVEGENYLQITRLLQGYIENEINLNSQGSCTQQCSDYSLAQSRDECVKGSICNKQDKCRGNITNCQSMKDDMWICPGGGRNDLRRYGYITYDNGDIMGQAYSCDGYHVSFMRYFFLFSAHLKLIISCSWTSRGHLIWFFDVNIASAFAMNKAKSRIDTSACDRLNLISKITCKCFQSIQLLYILNESKYAKYAKYA